MTVRRRAAAVALVLALALAGCSGLPLSGPVSVGNAPGDAVDDVTAGSYAADEPRQGWTPSEIVDGFLRASISPAQSWSTAREFLMGDLADTWDPQAGVTIDTTDTRDIVESIPDGEAATATAGIHAEATVDEDGRYRVAEDGATTSLAFELARDDQGEWRITTAPDGIVLDRQYFEELYSAHNLYYFDTTWTFLVPDSRWFLDRQSSATRIVQELVEGAPSDWLLPGVQTAFGSDMRLARGTVPVDADRVAQIEITGAAGADDEELSRMTAQLEQSLAATARAVSLTVDGQESEVAAAPVGDTHIDSRPLVLTDDGFGYLAGGELSPVDTLSDALSHFSEDISSITLSSDESVAAVGLADGGVMRVTEDSPDEIDVGAASVAPALDAFGYVWTVRAGDPGSLTAWDPGLAPLPLSGGWADVSSVSAIDVSRDGARIAAIVTIGGERWAVVSAIERDLDGRPVSVGAPLRVSQLRMDGIGLAWINDGTLGIAAGGTDSAVMVQQPLGGPSTDANAAIPLDVTTVGAGNQDFAVRLLTGSGDLLVLRGGRNPTTVATGVRVLATPLGLPD